MDENLILLIEKFLEKNEKRVLFTFKNLIPTIIFTFIPLIFEIMELIDKLNTENPKVLVEFKEYLVLEKSKLDNQYSFFFEGIQNISLFSLIFLFAKNIEKVSNLETSLSTISIFIFVFPLVVSLFILFEKKRNYKFNQLLIFLNAII